MNAIVQELADSHNIKRLRYIFLDSLDVDPTFENYEEEFNYCKDLDGLFEPHIDMMPMIEDKSQWDNDYWVSLKEDFRKNFSRERFNHMMEVAKVVYADKVQRLIEERRVRQEQNSDNVSRSLDVNPFIEQKDNKPLHYSVNNDKQGITEKERQDKELTEKKRRIERENAEIDAKQKAQRERIEAGRRAAQARQNAARSADNDDSKKALGAALVIIVILALILFLLLR